MRLYTSAGNRLYLTPSERECFIVVADKYPPWERTFCLMLAYTGCRISEARHLRRHDLQLPERVVAVRTLKQRTSVKIREIPIPELFADILHQTHCAKHTPPDQFLWSQGNQPPPRSSVYRWVKGVMAEAGIDGVHASPKGLRHGYGIHATRCGIQLHMLQKWMGHARMETTAIYATALGPEEQEIANRMWSSRRPLSNHVRARCN